MVCWLRCLIKIKSRRKIWNTIVDLQREITGSDTAHEEAGIHANAQSIAVVCENFFKGFGGDINGLDCHTIEFYYHMKIVDEDVSLCKSVTDDGEKLVWLPIDEIRTSNIKPDFIRDNIEKILNERKTIHIIQEMDGYRLL